MNFAAELKQITNEFIATQASKLENDLLESIQLDRPKILAAAHRGEFQYTIARLSLTYRPKHIVDYVLDKLHGTEGLTFSQDGIYIYISWA